MGALKIWRVKKTIFSILLKLPIIEKYRLIYFNVLIFYVQLFSLVGDNWIYDTPLAKRLANNGEPQ